jgi:hypothetical protein
MTLQFLRNARLRVGANDKLIREYQGFRITFKIDKSLASTPNTGIISIYNLNSSSQNLLETKDAICTLEVGYGEELTQIFVGNIARVTNKKQGIDLITELELGDGELGYQKAKVDLSFPAGANITSVIDSVANTFKEVKNGGIKTIKNTVSNTIKTFATGFVASGSSKDVLDSLTKTAGLEWSIQDSELQFLQANKSTVETAILLSTETGLIGSVGKLKSTTPNAPSGGVEFACLLNPSLKCGRLVQLESLMVSGTYRVTKLIHEGDNFAGNWLSKCEAFLTQ